MSWMWGGLARVRGALPPHSFKHPDSDMMSIFGNQQYSSAVGFGSRHGDIVNFAFCDGSVHGINIEIHLETLYQLAGYQDGGRPGNY